MEKILSIGVAAYNVQDYLAECIESIVNTKVANKIELIIVDDGSKDDTKKIAMSYCASYPDTVKLISKDNGGWGSTLNASIKVATGKYFKQLDADDKYITDNLEAFIDILEKTDSDIVFTKYQTFNDESGDIMDVIDVLPNTISNKGLVKNLPYDLKIPMHGVSVRSAILKEKDINITEHCFYTDVEFVIKAVNRCKTYMYSDIIVYSYRLERAGQSVSLEGKRKHYKDHERTLRENLRVYKEEIDEQLRDMIHYRLSEMIKYQYEIFFILEPSDTHKKELIEFDEYIKNEFNEFYSSVGKKVKLLRMSNFVAYTSIVKANLKNK